MGWDMFARGPKGGRVRELKAFRAAAALVVAEAGSVDCFLEAGGLDCSPCARALEDMTGHSAWAVWQPAEIRERFANAKLPDDIEPDEKWAYLSAWHFLRVCAENGYSAEGC